DAYEMMADAVELCDIVKMNDEELKLLTGTEDAYTGLKAIIDMGPELAAVTFGEDGCAYAGAEDFGEIEGLDVNAIDTTGCGDAFVAATLTRLVQADKDITELGGNELREIYQFANAAAAFAATGNGAIPAMPSADEVETMLKSGL
ncbi:MAG: PfkB family carbohydrate kinase, partial [Armatimonadota bacterium]